MKLRISHEQYEELSVDGKQVWSTWTRKKGYAERPTIAELLEFLYERKNITNLHTLEGCYNEGIDGWHVVINDPRGWLNGATCEEKELCDALWEAVLEVLDG